MADDCSDSHTSLKCRRTQMGMLGLLNLVGSSSRPARSLAARRVPDQPVRRSALLDSSSQPPAIDDTPSHSLSEASSDPEGATDDPPLPPDADDLSDTTDPTCPRPEVPGNRLGAHSRRRGSRPSTRSQVERQGTLKGLITAALRRLLGARTRADATTSGSMMATIVSSTLAPSRVLFCVLGPLAVDLAALWFSPDGLPLCSCWGHTENVALLSMSGDSSTCWHAEAFKAAVCDLSDHKEALIKHLQVADGIAPYAVDISTHKGMAAVAFDGTIYSPVVATRRRDVKCVAVSCRSNPRRCHHAELVKGLGRMAVRNDDDADVSDSFSDDDQSAKNGEDDDDQGVADEDDLITIARGRQKRNLVACRKEDEQCEAWARTAEWAADGLGSVPVLSTPPVAGSEATQSPPPALSVLQRLSELGVAFDPNVPLYEKTCSKCQVTKPVDTELKKQSGKLYCDGNSKQPLSVRSGHAFFAYRRALVLPVTFSTLCSLVLLGLVRKLTDWVSTVLLLSPYSLCVIGYEPMYCCLRR